MPKHSRGILGSASTLHRTLECPGSQLLPHAPDTAGPAAIRGTAIHDYLENIGQLDQLDKVPEEYKEDCKRINLNDVAGKYVQPSLREIKFALNLETGKARVILRDGHRDYGDIAPHEISGTADIALAGFKMVEVHDYKTGRYDRKKKPVATNPQLLFAALCAKKTISPHAEWFLLGIQQILKTKINTWTALVDTFDLERFEQKARKAWQVTKQIQSDVEEGGQVPVKRGDHCWFCPAKDNCPAWATSPKYRK